MPTSTPHDALFKCTFGRPDVARSELQLVLPPALLARLDLSTLAVLPNSFVDEKLRQTHSDLLYSLQTVSEEPALVCALAEHQSHFDATMPLRLLDYSVRVWWWWLSEHPESKLPFIICIVLHHGEHRWGARPELAAMLGADAETLTATRTFTPHFQYIVDDLAALSLDALAHRTIHVLGRLAQIAFWTAADMERLEQAAPLMRKLARAVTRDVSTRTLLAQLYAYLLNVFKDLDRQMVYDKVLLIAGPEGKDDVLTIAEALRAEGRTEGRLEGRVEGQLEALRSVIVKALMARKVALSKAGRAQLEACTDPKLLDRWYERALLAKKESDVFAPSGRARTTRARGTTSR